MEIQREKQLIRQVLQGDTRAFAVLIDAHKDHVFNLVLRIVRRREWAEEISQDVFLKAFQELHKFKQEARFSTWLFRIAYNMSISELRKRQLPVQDFNENSVQVADESTHEERETQFRQLHQALDLLPAEERALITLFYTENKSIEDICNVTGFSISNVKVKLHRARQKLKEMVKGEKPV